MAATTQTATAADPIEFGPQQKSRGLWALAFRRLRRNRLAMVGAAILVTFIMMSVLVAAVPAVARHDAGQPDIRNQLASPTGEHWFGTDALGRDSWARAWEGMGISLRIGLATQIIVVAIGLSVGAAAAFGGKFTDNLLMRVVDIAYAFPDLLAIILMRAVLSERDWPIIGTGDPQIPGMPGTLLQVTVAISLVGWVTIARLVRGQMLALKETDYVLAARAMGASAPRVVFVHMMPNTLGPVIVAITFGIPLAIYAEAVLALIGFGVTPPTASLGTLVLDGYTYYRTNAWMILIPSLGIAILMLSFTFLGDGLRDALDPRIRDSG